MGGFQLPPYILVVFGPLNSDTSGAILEIPYCFYKITPTVHVIKVNEDRFCKLALLADRICMPPFSFLVQCNHNSEDKVSTNNSRSVLGLG